jgi:hypothetical protein
MYTYNACVANSGRRQWISPAPKNDYKRAHRITIIAGLIYVYIKAFYV